EDQQVAVKILYPRHSQDISFLQRFMQEARLAMKLSECAASRQIVCVLDYGSDRDTHYLVMEYVRGQDLGQELNERGPLPWQRALDIGRQVALALGHAHKHGVVHRDIKPGNIMLRADGTICVLDFGIARAQTSPELTLAGFVGSPHYAAPEQAMGETVDIRADIYSLGVVLYRMLTGELPFEGNAPWAIVNQHISSPFPLLEESHPDLPAAVIRLVEKTMAKQPQDRFQTPVEMVKAIEIILTGGDLPTEEPADALARGAPSLDDLYQRAQEAIEAEAWQKAVNLLNQISRTDQEYQGVAEQLREAGQQIRLAALYQAVQRLLQLEQWGEALTALDEISNIDPGYRNIDDLRAQAEMQQKLLTEERAAASDYPTQIETPNLEYDPAQAEPPQPSKPVPPRGLPRRTWLWALVPIFILALITALYFVRYNQQPSAAITSSTSTHTATPRLSPTRQATFSAAPSHTPSSSPRTTTATVTPTATSISTPTATSTPTTPPRAPTDTTRPSTTDIGLAGQIAFPRFDSARQTYDVYVCRVDGSNCRGIVAEASQPDFLPSGDQIVVHSWKPDEKGLVLHILAEQRIWRITDRIEAARPSVGFEGKMYVYHSRQEADRQPRLYRTHGTQTRPIRREGSGVLGLSPSWLPDGRILYSGCWRDECGILVMHADGTNPRQVVAGSTETNPEASPDGQRVTFMSQRDGNWEVYVVNLDGSGLRRLTQNPASDGLPTWSPAPKGGKGGQYLAFVSNRTGRWAIWVMRPDGSEQRRLFDINGPLDGQVRDAAPHEIHGWVEERISWGPSP
ncbi:MAG: protein kinase, partial [Anaerolineae bacterium]